MVQQYLNTVAHSHRIGAADAFQTEITFNLARYNWSLVCLDEVPAPCIFDDKSSQGITFLLYRHDFLVLHSKQLVNLLYVLVVQLLQLFFAIFLEIL